MRYVVEIRAVRPGEKFINGTEVIVASNPPPNHFCIVVLDEYRVTGFAYPGDPGNPDDPQSNQPIGDRKGDRRDDVT